MSSNYGKLIFEKFKLNGNEEVIQLGNFRLLSVEGENYATFFGTIYTFEISIEHFREDFVRGQDSIHVFKMNIKQGHYAMETFLTNESLDIVGKEGFIKSIRRICHEILDRRLKDSLVGEGVRRS